MTTKRTLTAEINLADEFNDDEEKQTMDDYHPKQALDDLETTQKDEKEKCGLKCMVSKIQSVVQLLVMPIISLFGVFDLITDINLLYKIQQDSALILIAILMSLSILAPYLICYASCTRLYLNGGVFDNINNKSIAIKILFFIYFLPFGILYYIILD
eukprot:274960_1